MFPKNLTRLLFAIFEFKTRFLNDCSLPPFKGSTIRGAFGHKLKEISCRMTHNHNCHTCLLKSSCVYSYVFESIPFEETKRMKKYPSVPHPFIIEPPPEKKRNYKEGDPFNFKIILIGKAIDSLPYIVYAFEKTGETGLGYENRGKYVIESLINHNFLMEEKSVLYSHGDSALKFPAYITQVKQVNDVIETWGDIDEVTFNFLTPARIKYADSLISYLEFHIFIRNFLRRLSSIFYFHCGEELDINYKEVIDKSRFVDVVKSTLKWEEYDRYSSRQESKMKLGGFKGKVKFRGPLKEFALLIMLGKFFHVGKAASFGLGKYEVEF